MPQVRERLKTERGGDVPSVRQVSVFTENRIGAMAALLSVFDSTKVRILALTVVHGFDCAIVRFVLSDTDVATKELIDANYRFTVCDLVAVEVPPGGEGLQLIAKALLAAEIDVHYCYALISSEKIRPSIVVHVDNPSLAAQVLTEARFHLLDEADLRN
ncbi:MAG: hypothetical protein FWD61_11150 [Phycisphaerales bacterium]|nr:hypothetical protein [Phycisphaerales bacterium]